MTEARPKVSVIIIVRNGADTIRVQLDALANQRGAAPVFEVVIADNGSTDSTADIVREWIAEGPKAHTTARLVDASRKKGIPFARNAGALASRGEILAFCDADDVVADDWVAAVAAGTPAPGMMGGRTEAFGPDGMARPDASTSDLMRTHYLPFAPGCNFAVSRDCFFAVGGFDESLPPYGFDDVEFSWRVQKAGYPLRYVPDAVVRFSVTGSIGSIRKVLLLAKGRMIVIRRHPEFATMTYSLRSCMSDARRQTMDMMRALAGDPGARNRQARAMVAAYGRLYGHWYYAVRGKQSTPELVGPDPLAQ